MRFHAAAFFSLIMIVTIAACDSSSYPVGNTAVPEPMRAVEVERYLGTWYEQARYENRFEIGCKNVTAEYSLRDDGKLRVANTCVHQERGTSKTATGIAKIVHDSENTKLKVSFFRPFYGDYWILDRASDYSWSIVGEPSGKFLWILTREKNVSDAMMKNLTNRAAKMGYDISLLTRTTQD